MRRRIVPVAVAATLVLTGLTACAAPDAGAGCVNPLQPGPLSDGVSAGSGDVSVTGPADILNAQRSVLKQSDDQEREAAVPGGIVTADVTIVDAKTGSVINRRDSAPHLVLPENMIGEAREALKGEQSASMGMDYLIATALLCAVPGQTLSVAATPSQSMASQLGTSATVAVIDVLQAAPAHAQGGLRGLPSGFPAVATDETGRPGIVLPPEAAPSKLQVAPRILGSGAKVTEKSSVIGQALTVNWSGNVVANTWESGITGFGTVEQPNPAFTFREQLNGYPVGSQLVILDPADGEPVVHVVDIVAAS